MDGAYDDKKNEENIRKHGVSFEAIYSFDWETAITKKDIRLDYGGDRFISYGFLAERLHVLVWTERDGVIRPISFRKANQRERGRYDRDGS